MNELLFPQEAKTGKVAELEVTTRESKSVASALNVRLSLPGETLVLNHPNGDRQTLTEAGAGSTPVIQFQLGLN